MNPIISYNHFLESKDIINRYQGLTCWLLYSDMHSALTKFIREKWHAIDAMTDHQCLLCLMDKPTSWDSPYWSNANIEPDFGFLMNSRPFDRNNHFILARNIGLEYNDLPAFVFFSSVNSKENLVIKIDQYDTERQLTDTFSQVMDCVSKSINESRKTPQFEWPISKMEHWRGHCHELLRAEINRRKISSMAKRLVTPSTVLGAAKIAVSL